MAKPPFKLGINIGTFREGNRDDIYRTSHERGEFESDIRDPYAAIDRANRYIHERFGDNFNLSLFDGNQRRRSRRRT